MGRLHRMPLLCKAASAANVLVQQYGIEDALLMAAKRADALLELGDVDGQRVWKSVLRAVQQLVRVERLKDELEGHPDGRAFNATSGGYMGRHCWLWDKPYQCHTNLVPAPSSDDNPTGATSC